MNEIYIKIKSIRLKKGLKQEEIAEKLKMTQSNYARLERGLTQITFERLEELAAIFEMSVENILKFNEEADFKEDAKYYFKELQKALNKIKALEEKVKELENDDFWFKENQKLEAEVKELKQKVKDKNAEIESLKEQQKQAIDFKDKIIVEKERMVNFLEGYVETLKSK